MPERSLRIGIVASATQSAGQPFAGGMEAHTATLARALRVRGHQVTIHAARAEGDGVRPVLAPAAHLRLSAAAKGDVSMPAASFMAEHHAYLSLMMGIDACGYDVIHNNCLHYLPVAMAPLLRTPMVTTLHSPPTPWLESAIRCRPATENPFWVSVSRANARAWRHLCACEVIHNGVDPAAWPFSPRPESRAAIWSGRIVPEKGLHLAIAAARHAGLPLAIAGPIGDEAYFRRAMAGTGDEVAYRGHLGTDALARLVGAAAVSLVTPCWDEPFGLVAIEALACGTPVAAFDRGALAEILDVECGALARPDDPVDLAERIGEALLKDRRACRARVVRHFSLGAMTDGYVRAYEALL